jgi:hypothetical protein
VFRLNVYLLEWPTHLNYVKFCLSRRCIFLYTIENSFLNISSHLGFLVPREKSTKFCSFCQSCCIKTPNSLNRSKLTENLLSFYLALSFAKMKVQPKNWMKSISKSSETWYFWFRVLRYRILIFALKSVRFRITHYSLIYQDPTWPIKWLKFFRFCTKTTCIWLNAGNEALVVSFLFACSLWRLRMHRRIDLQFLFFFVKQANNKKVYFS